VTFSLAQGYCKSCHSIGHVWYPICFDCYSVSNLLLFRDFMDYFQRLKMSRDRDHALLNDLFVNSRAILHMAKQCTKFEVSSIRCPVIFWGDSLLCICCTCDDQSAYQIWSLYIHPLRRYEIGLVWGLDRVHICTTFYVHILYRFGLITSYLWKVADFNTHLALVAPNGVTPFEFRNIKTESTM